MCFRFCPNSIIFSLALTAPCTWVNKAPYKLKTLPLVNVNFKFNIYLPKICLQFYINQSTGVYIFFNSIPLFFFRIKYFFFKLQKIKLEVVYIYSINCKFLKLFWKTVRNINLILEIKLFFFLRWAWEEMIFYEKKTEFFIISNKVGNF